MLTLRDAFVKFLFRNARFLNSHIKLPDNPWEKTKYCCPENPDSTRVPTKYFAKANWNIRTHVIVSFLVRLRLVSALGRGFARLPRACRVQQYTRESVARDSCSNIDPMGVALMFGLSYCSPPKEGPEKFCKSELEYLFFFWLRNAVLFVFTQ